MLVAIGPPTLSSAPAAMGSASGAAPWLGYTVRPRQQAVADDCAVPWPTVDSMLAGTGV